MQQYDYTIIHIPGKDNNTADCLSRLLCCAVEDLMAIGDMTFTDEKQSMLNLCHNAVIGHRGISATMSLIRQLCDFPWPQLREDVTKFIGACVTCQRFRSGRTLEARHVGTIACTKLFSEWAVDTVGPLPEDSGMRYILVCQDAFSRYVETFAIPDTTADVVVGPLVSIVCRYGIPKYIRSDHGPQFDNQVINLLCERLTVDRKFSFPYRPQGNSQVERVNGEVMKHLRNLVEETQKWVVALPLATRIVNSIPNRTTGFAPAVLALGLSLDDNLLSPNFLHDIPEAERITPPESIELFQKVHTAVIAAAERSQLNTLIRRGVLESDLPGQHTPDSPTDDVVPEPTEIETKDDDVLRAGDWVLIGAPPGPRTRSNKLAPLYNGPFRIVQEVTHDHFTIFDHIRGTESDVHVSRLKRFKNTDVSIDPASILRAQKQVWVVESVTEMRIRPGARKHSGRYRLSDHQFKTFWTGYGDDFSWVDYEEIKRTEPFIKFLRLHPELKQFKQLVSLPDDE